MTRVYRPHIALSSPPDALGELSSAGARTQAGERTTTEGESTLGVARANDSDRNPARPHPETGESRVESGPKIIHAEYGIGLLIATSRRRGGSLATPFRHRPFRFLARLYANP